MRRLSTAVIIIIAFAGCPSSDDPPGDPDAPDDGGGDDRMMGCDGGLFCTPPPPQCNPLAEPGNQGCNPGEKCAWEIVAEEPERLGRLACVTDGTVAVDGACTAATVGAPDDCVAGAVCVSGTCHDICGFDGSAEAACATTHACTRYDGLFANGDDDPIAGACNPQCDPLAQLAPGGNTCGTGNGCYLLTSQTDTIAVCAGAGEVNHGAAITGPAFANSCVPGAQPRRRDQTTMTVECGGLCRPADVTSTTNMASEAGVAPDSCTNRWGAAPPGDGVAGESCRYWWARESFPELSLHSNTVGWCFKHVAFQYDSDGDTTPDRPIPRCTTLTTGDVVPPIGDPPHNDAQFFWCTALPTAFTGAPAARPAAPPVLRVDRLRL